MDLCQIHSTQLHFSGVREGDVTVDGLADVPLLRSFPGPRMVVSAERACTALSSVKAPVNLLSVAFGSPPSFALEFYRHSLPIYRVSVRDNGLYTVLVLSDYGFV